MKNLLQGKRVGVLVLCLASLAACDKIADQSRAAQSVTKQAFEDSKSSWQDFFMYHPPTPAPLPQTRYCYQMQSDIVCYDSEQRQLVSKLIGYQDGENISWVQPGGGSLGASGGEPIALRPMPVRKTSNTPAPQPDYSMDASGIDTGPVDAGLSNTTRSEEWLYDKSTDTYRKVTSVSSAAPAAATSTVQANDSVSVSELPTGR